MTPSHPSRHRPWALVPCAFLLFLFGTPLAGGQIPIPPGWVQVDDEILPVEVVFGDATYLGTAWPGGLVYYQFDANVSTTNRNRTLKAMAEWECVANVKFIPRTTQSSYVHIQSGNSNSSFVGMVGGGQTLTMFNWSFKYIICHELAHALSFRHEHTRPDRNTYVTINSQNIQSGQSGNFTLQPSATTVGAYDFLSIMHYDGWAFSSNNQQTITCNAGYTQFQNQIGNRDYMTVLDAQGMAARYGPPPVPVITTVTPSTVAQGSPSALLTITGGPFHEGATQGVLGTRVRFNGFPLNTTYITSTQIQALVPNSYLFAAGCSNLTVENPAPGGGTSSAYTFVVTATGGGGMTVSVPGNYVTIQAAINAVCPGTTILVGPGTYNENLDLGAKNLVLRGTGGAALTTLDGQMNGAVVKVPGGQTSATVIEGFTIRNGSGFSPSGSASGGGIYVAAASPKFKNCIVQGCAAQLGGGIYCAVGGTPEFVNCLVSGCSATLGAGIYSGAAGSRFVNCTVANNQLTGLFGGSGIHTLVAGVIITNCVVYGNTGGLAPTPIGFLTDAVTYTLTDVAIAGVGNVVGDPRFVNVPANDFHLGPGSQAANVGNPTATGLPTTDLDGDSRSLYLIPDMGYDEFNPPATMTLTLDQPLGSGSLRVLNAGGPSSDPYITLLTFDTANAGPGLGNGPFGGLHMGLLEVIDQILLGTPPFVGLLSGAGGSLFQLPAGTISPAANGFVLYGVTHTTDTVTGGLGVRSAPTSVTFQ